MRGKKEGRESRNNKTREKGGWMALYYTILTQLGEEGEGGSS